MAVDLPQPPLLLVTDRHVAAGPLVASVAAAFEAGLRWVSLREKDLDHRALRALARELVILGRPFGAMVTVHGDLRAARKAAAGGLHLPSRGELGEAREVLRPDALVGMSAHDLEEVRWASERQVDYITFSPVFPSISKPGYGSHEGLPRLQEAAAAVSTPIVALGGITPEHVEACVTAGARGVAAAGAILTAPNPGDATRELLDALSAALHHTERPSP